MSLQIVVSGSTTEITQRFYPPIELDADKDYEMALVRLETYYSFPNIDSSNNQLRYSPDSGSTWFRIAIPEGCYDIYDLNDSIQVQLKQNGHYDRAKDEYPLSLSANSSTLKSVIGMNRLYQIDFRIPNSLNTVLGFEKKLYQPISGRNWTRLESEHGVDIMKVNSLLIHVDCVAGSYVDGRQEDVIYSFFPEVSPGYKIVETPTNLVYHPVFKGKINTMTVRVTDQNLKLLNLRGEKLTMRFHLRGIKKDKKDVDKEENKL